MLRFAVFDNDGPAAEWPLVNAYMIGPDDQPIRGEVTFEAGHVVCHKGGADAAGLCLQYDAGSAGVLMLQTCLLPQRTRPYVLALELARHRIKTFIAKSEEWQMFDLSADHAATRLWEEARQLLTEAWINPDPLQADRVARQSLSKAIEATERLALAHADILLHRRFASRPASNSTLGVRIWPGRNASPLRDLVSKEFDVLVVPLNWRELAEKEGKYDWDPVDRWMDWATRTGKPVVTGPLLDFSKRCMPEWMQVWQNDYDTTRDLAYDHLERVVTRYRSAVGIWNIASGVNTCENLPLTPEQMLDLVRMASLLVKQSHRGAKVMVELAEPWGEHCAVNRESVHPMAFVDRLVQEGIRIDAVGVQVLMGQAGDGRPTRDLMQISMMLDRFFLLERPIIISTLGAPSERIDPRGGTWHEEWSPEHQARWISRVFAVAMSKPFVESIFWNDLFDHASAELPMGGLISDAGQPKPGLQKIVSLRRHLRKPLGPLKLPTRAGAVVIEEGDSKSSRNSARGESLARRGN
jgi:GH35 family endo-1,4-beta-xylanase